MDTELKSKLSDLSPSQLKELMKKMGKEKKEMPLMTRNESQLYPVTSAQKRMWFLSKLDPDSYLYTNPIGIRVKSKQIIDIDLFVKGFKTVVERHEIMRTSFVNAEGQIFQKIHDHVSFEIEKIDLSSLPSEEREAKMYAILEQDGQQIIRIESLPLFRFTQLTLSPNEFVFIYTSHHIISDAWSSSFIFRSMQEIFEQALKGISPSSAKLKYQFIDYVNWEQNWLVSNEYKNAMAKWREMLPEAPEPINLPLDFKRPKTINYQGSLYKTTFGKDLVDALRIFSKKEGVTLFHTLLSCFNIALYKYSKNEEIVVGIPMSNRKLKEFQETIGMFLNTLPHRTLVNDSLLFRDYLNQVRQVSQDMMTHQDVPFDKITEALNPVRDMAISPLFQVLFVFQNIPAMYEWENLSVAPVKSDYSISKYDLNLWLEEVADELILSMTCQTSLFRKEMMPQFLAYYESILKHILTNPEEKIADINISDEQFIASPETEPNEYTSYLSGFENQVLTQPNKPALRFNEQVYSYTQLNELANQVAHYLLQTKKEESIIGLAMDRTPELLITLLAIHKIGVAYLPIDIQLPKERLAYIIADSGIKTVITNGIIETIFEDFEIESLIFKDIINPSQQLEKTNPSVKITGNTPAYIIYTSGSTGQPKGVCIEHAQLLNYSVAIWKRMQLSADSNFASISAFTTDLGNTQIFPTLLHGGCITLVPDAFLTNPGSFSSYIDKHQVDCLKIVPSYLRSLLAVEEGFGILPKKLLILGGEAIPASLLLKIRASRPDLRIINHYGPTETTIGILTHEIGTVSENSIIPLGKALDNNTVVIVDSQNRPLPKGIPGEIIVYGNNVGLGYINNENLTAQSFIPLDGNPEIRGYKTGDIGRIDYDGNIEFLGRKDRQIKVRGFRVEIDEIEKALLLNPAITEAAIIAKNEQSLIAYITTNNNVDISKIKQELKAHLPAYMIPDEIIVVESIPRHGNGKVNTKALENLSNINTQTEQNTDIQPRDEVELTIKGIWEEVLKQNVKGIHIDFFDAGGNSLMAIEIIAKLNKHFTTDFSIAVLFECPTIHLLASKIRKGNYSTSQSPLVLLRKGTGNSNLFLVHPAGGDVLSYYDLARNIDSDYSIYGLQAKKTDEKLDSIQQVAELYLEAITKEIPDGDFIFGGWSMGALVAYEMARLHQNNSEKYSPVIILDQKAPAELDGSTMNTVDKLSLFGEKINHLVGRKTQLTKTALEGLTDTDRSTLFLQEFKESNLVPEDLKPEEFHGFLDVMLYHNEITIKYQTETYNGPVLLIRAADSTFADDATTITNDYGWINYVPETLSVIEVQGNHITIIRKPNVENVGKQISLYLKNKS
jgi:amino acid adenylation domain-containing protein